MRYIGVDVGKDGALVMIDEEASYGEEIMKFKFPMIGTDYDIQRLNNLFKNVSKEKCHMVIEDVHAIAGGSAKANWSFSRGKAILETLAIVNDIPFTMVKPKTWQKVIHEGIPKMPKAKDMTLMAVQRLYPNIDLRRNERCKKPDEGIYDALAMAHYCKLKLV
jgi:hypothetical protein